jgi:hypothetical protein
MSKIVQFNKSFKALNGAKSSENKIIFQDCKSYALSIIYKTLHRKLEIEQHKRHYVTEESTVPAPLVTPITLLLKSSSDTEITLVYINT